MDEANADQGTVGINASGGHPIGKHQPPAESVVREFADHIDRERQAFKDWVRKEIGLLVQGKSHDERAAENP